MNAPRIYPARLAPRERKLLGDALAALSGKHDADEVARAISHRLACATRYDEMREKRLTAEEREAIASTLRGVLAGLILTGCADMARANARALVRLLR